MKPQVRTLADRAFDEVRERILSGKLPANAPIRQDALALELGLSKIPLREALTRLESGGLVASHPHRGFIVRALSRREAEDVFDLRLKLEPDATAQGALEADQDARDAAEAALEALDKALRRKSAEVGRRNREFHLALIRPCGRDVTTDTLERLLGLSERYVRVHLGSNGRAERASREHEGLLEAWLDQRAATVKRDTERHINATLRDLRAELRGD